MRPIPLLEGIMSMHTFGFVVSFLSLLTSVTLIAIPQRSYWPGIAGKDWEPLSEVKKKSLKAKKACMDFEKNLFSLDTKEKWEADNKLPEKDQALRSDGVMVIKNGQVWYEHYNSPYDKYPKLLHPMWSASKSLTAAVVAAVAELTSSSKKPLKLTTRVNEILSEKEWKAINSDLFFGEITVEELLAMAPNLQWKEKYGDVKDSSITKMLWVEGYPDMAKFAGDQEFGPEKKGNKFIYSSGNAVILFRLLKALYPKEKEYIEMPWKVLFDRIGMTKVVLEQDQSGTFVGSSYLHTSLRDMAKFGYLYLNEGYYGESKEGKIKVSRVLHPEFYQKTKELSIGMRAEGTTDKDILSEEAFYGSGFWLNSDPNQLEKDNIRRFGPKFPMKKFFPHAPSDMYFAAGHYGQIILIFPSQDLMLVRFGYDKEYFSKIDSLVQRTFACFIEE